MRDRREFLKSAAAMAAMGLALGFGPSRAMPDPEIAGYIKARGGRLWYRINGARHLGGAKAPLLVLHGGPGGNHRRLLPLVALAEDRAVILYDQLDSGHSDRPGDPANWTTERFVSEIDSVRDALKLKRVALLGHSMGGGWAGAYAVEQPKGLAALVLSSPLISTRRWIEDANALRRELPEDVQRALAANEAAGTLDTEEYRAATRVFYERHLCKPPCPVGDLSNDAPPSNGALYEYMWGPTEFRATGTLVDFDLTPGLNSIRAPTLFVCGEFDEATPASCMAFAAMTPGARFELIEGAAHATYLEGREDYLATLRRFFASVGV